eukprot:COSAG06_NODE_909_length_11599_cov_61.006087_8_plen_90_part_00
MMTLMTRNKRTNPSLLRFVATTIAPVVISPRQAKGKGKKVSRVSWICAGRQQIEMAVDTTNLKVQELLPSFYTSSTNDERQPVVNVTTR